MNKPSDINVIHDSIFTIPVTTTTVDATTVNATTVNATTVDATTLTTDTFTSDGTKIGFFGATTITKPSGAGQAEVTFGNANSEIGDLTIGGTYSQSEVQALRDKCEELADDARNLQTLVHALRTALVNLGLIKGAA